MYHWILKSTNSATPVAMGSVLSLSLSALMLVLLSTGCSDLLNNASSVTELGSVDLVVGDGAESVKGTSVVVHYTGWVYDSSKDDNKGVRFDSSRDRGMPFAFMPGRGVIEGWSKGVVGMKVGGVRVLTIPSEMAYGEKGAPGALIPPNAALIFEIELLKVRK